MAHDRLLSAPFLLCFVVNLLQGLAFSLFLHFPGYLQQLGADEAQIGLISGLTAIAAIAVRPPVGRVMDRRGRRVVILWGGALNILAVGLYLTVHRIDLWIYVVRILHGLAEALLFSSLFTYAADFVPPNRRTQGLALFGVSGILPISLGGVLGDQILSIWSYTAIFVTSLALATLSWVCSLPMIERPRSDTEREPARGFTAALAQHDLRPLWLVGTVFSIAITVFWVFIKTFVEETQIGSVGLFFTAYTASALVLRVFFGWVPDRYGPKRVLLPAMLALVIGFVLLGSAKSVVAVGVAGAMCGIGHGYTFPILFGLVVTRAREADRGAAMAIFTALFDLGVLLGGPAFGLLIEQGGYPIMFRSAAAFTAMGALVFFVWDGRRARAASAALLVLVACGSTPGYVAALREKTEGLAPGRLTETHPYVLPKDATVTLLLCRWKTDAPIGVFVDGAAGPDEERAVEAALRAWERTALGVRFRRVNAKDASIRIALVEAPVARESGERGAGRAVVDCAVAESELVSATLEISRRAAENARGEARRLDPEELAGVALHELGHALGFQGHVRGGETVMVRTPETLRRLGAHALAGEPIEAPELVALYSLPSLTALTKVAVARWRTDLVDRMGTLAIEHGMGGPYLRVGDRSARIYWRDARNVEYGLEVVNLAETLRDPERILVVPEHRTRRALPRSRDLPPE